MKTGIKRQKNSERGEKTTSATVDVADVKLGGSTLKHSKSLDISAGDVNTGIKGEKNSETGEKATFATQSKNSKSLDISAGDEKIGIMREKNSETGETKTSATIQAANVKLAGSTSKH